MKDEIKGMDVRTNVTAKEVVNEIKSIFKGATEVSGHIEVKVEEKEILGERVKTGHQIINIEMEFFKESESTDPHAFAQKQAEKFFKENGKEGVTVLIDELLEKIRSNHESKEPKPVSEIVSSFLRRKAH